MIDRPHDCSPEQAFKWANTEAGKCATIKQISDRLEQEFTLSKIMNNQTNNEHFPNLVQGHNDLIKLLISKREKLERLKAFTVIQGGKE